MTLDARAVGRSTGTLTHPYDWKDVVLYALGVGATRNELDYLYEGRGPRVLPTFAVIPTFAANAELFGVLGGDMMGVVHGGQMVRLHRPFSPEGVLHTVGTVKGVYDLKRMATAVIATETRDGSGELVCETEWSIIFRFDGGFGGEAPPRTPRVHVPEREADFVVEEGIREEQALLYRLNGDVNPLHADPSIGEQAGFGGPILHGLCTYGFVGRAVLQACCDGDAGRFKLLSGQFRKPVFPGDVLVTEGWREDGRVVLRASAKARPGEYVFSNAFAEVS